MRVHAAADKSLIFSLWVDLLLLLQLIIAQHAIALFCCYHMPAAIAENIWKSVLCDEVIRFRRWHDSFMCFASEIGTIRVSGSSLIFLRSACSEWNGKKFFLLDSDRLLMVTRSEFIIRWIFDDPFYGSLRDVFGEMFGEGWWCIGGFMDGKDVRSILKWNARNLWDCLRNFQDAFEIEAKSSENSKEFKLILKITKPKVVKMS